jgi:hypothetical protein
LCLLTSSLVNLGVGEEIGAGAGTEPPPDPAAYTGVVEVSNSAKANSAFMNEC